MRERGKETPSCQERSWAQSVELGFRGKIPKSGLKRRKTDPALLRVSGEDPGQGESQRGEKSGPMQPGGTNILQIGREVPWRLNKYRGKETWEKKGDRRRKQRSAGWERGYFLATRAALR